MQTKIIIGIVVAIALLGGGGYVIYSATQKNQVPYRGMMGQTDDTRSGMQSLKDLLTSQAVVACTFDDVEANVASQGTAYIANGKVRVDYTSTVDGKAENGHMIMDGNTSYLWSSSMPQGIKMMIDQTQTVENQNGQTPAIDPDEEVDYRCTPWVVEGSKFTPPSEIEFTDYANLLQGMMGGGAAGTVEAGSGVEVGADDVSTGGNLKAMQCAACSNIDDAEQQAQCKTALGC